MHYRYMMDIVFFLCYILNVGMAVVNMRETVNLPLNEKIRI